jgi:hypothetical protein
VSIETSISVDGVAYDLAHTSMWRRIYTCKDCGDQTDDGDHADVCGMCGGQEFGTDIGRWHAYHRNDTLWQDIKKFFTGGWSPFIKFKCELKENNP